MSATNPLKAGLAAIGAPAGDAAGGSPPATAPPLPPPLLVTLCMLVQSVNWPMRYSPTSGLLPLSEDKSFRVTAAARRV